MIFLSIERDLSNILNILSHMYFLQNNRFLMTPWMMMMMTIIVSLFIALFQIKDDCPFLVLIGGKSDITDRELF